MTAMTSNDTALRSRRLQSLPPYLFVEIDQRRRAKIAAGTDVINLGIGDPDRPTPRFIVDAMADAVRKPKYHQYPSDIGTQMFRTSAARFMQRRFGVEVDPDRHIRAVIGSKEGIFHLPLAVANAGDIVLCPDPGYPVYLSGAKFADADIHDMPLDAENGWKPRLDQVPADVANRAKLAWVNFPGNPTGACAPLDYYDEFVRFCIKHDIVAASDNAYSEIYFETPQPSMWQAPSAAIDETPGIEFHSCSKTFNMTGWRIGFCRRPSRRRRRPRRRQGQCGLRRLRGRPGGRRRRLRQLRPPRCPDHGRRLPRAT
jgi:LL-diaminopimelate aminotransferase